MDGIAVFKIDEYTQTSATAKTAGTSDLGVALYFTTDPGNGLGITLTGPNGGGDRGAVH